MVESASNQSFPLAADSGPETAPESAAERAYRLLFGDIIALRQKPGVRLSEAEIAAQMGLSRQPVREAFLRLSNQGFLLIRPKRPTLVAAISDSGVRQARFLRSAIEEALVAAAATAASRAKTAAERPADHIGEARDFAALREQVEANLALQTDAMSRMDIVSFNALDDGFHGLLAQCAGHAYAWHYVADQKAHMDRARLLNLAYQAGLRDAYEDHCAMWARIRVGDADGARRAMAAHLARIEMQLPALRRQNPDYFID